MDICDGPYVCGFFKNIFNMCLNSRRWFMLLMVHIPYLVLCCVRRWGLVLSTEPN
jgi:hypothetical protein